MHVDMHELVLEALAPAAFYLGEYVQPAMLIGEDAPIHSAPLVVAIVKFCPVGAHAIPIAQAA